MNFALLWLVHARYDGYEIRIAGFHVISVGVLLLGSKSVTASSSVWKRGVRVSGRKGWPPSSSFVVVEYCDWYFQPPSRLPLTCIVCTTRRLCEISAGSTISPRNPTTRFNLFNLNTQVKTCISLNNVIVVRGVSDFDLRVCFSTWTWDSEHSFPKPPTLCLQVRELYR